MKKNIGIFVFLLLVYGFLLFANPGARSMENHINLARRIGLFGVISLGAGMLIISGGIDLSIGSVVGLCATLFAMILRGESWIGRTFMQTTGTHDETLIGIFAIAVVLLTGMAIGLINGLLVTKVRVQAFVVTLCGLFVYRGIARWLANDTVKGLGTTYVGLKKALSGTVFTWEGPEPTNKQELFRGGASHWELPSSLAIFLMLVIVAVIFLHFSVYGRYFYAIGSNERAARYSGVATDRYKLLAYVMCSTLAAFFGVMFVMQENSSQPSSTGNFYELYAIAGAVLGGCSLRGGEGSVFGICIGTTILILLPNVTNMYDISPTLEYTVIGTALLLGAILDEVLRRFGTGRKL
ncbi:MAG TPA: ABC transporter permease [Gemmataceae bacterium]|nr:ABC transporter permease [Gemmataceae bacterium]